MEKSTARYLTLAQDPQFRQLLPTHNRYALAAKFSTSQRTVERAITYLRYIEALERAEERESAINEVSANLPVTREDGYIRLQGEGFEVDKKVSTFEWERACDTLIQMQELRKETKRSQNTAQIIIKDASHPIVLQPISDWHFGSYGTDYAAIKRWTRWLLDTPNLYIAIVGDMLQMAIKLRGVLEVMDNALTAQQQMRFLESWFADIAPKTLFATWDNHSVMREENASGFSRCAEIFAEKTVYHSGIGHPDIVLGDQVYRVCASHKFTGSSMLNPVHGPMRYLRMEAPDRDIAIQGDLHKPAVMQYPEGGRLRVVINCGSLQTNSGYAQRHFSLKTWDAFPGVKLYPDRHHMEPFWSLLEL